MRIYNLCHAAKSYFSQIYGLTTSNRRFFQQDPALALFDVPITEVPAWDLRRIAMVRKSAGNQNFVSSAVKQSVWGKWLRRLVDSFPFNVLIGDGGLIYIIKGYRAGKKLIREKNITHVFSTFRPYSDHVIGYLLKRKFPELVWVADFRDLHVDPITMSVLFPSFQRWCNRFFLKRADLLTTVSDGLEKHLIPFNPCTFVLYNGMLHLPQADAKLESSPKFVITYTGSLFFEERDPGLLFEVLSELQEEGYQNIEVIYAGKDGQQWQTMASSYGLESQSVDLGLIPLEEARQLQRTTCINLLLTYNSPELQGNLTGKIYEYFAARRPIVALVKGVKEPELEKIFTALNAGVVVYHDETGKDKLKNYIVDQYRIWETTGVLPDQIEISGLSRFHWPQMVDRLMERLHV